ncbi:MAG TPA: ATP-binding protein [Stenomitos sp.]
MPQSVWFGLGLLTGLSLWYWSSRRWQSQLGQLIRLFPAQSYSTTMPLQMRLRKAVQFQQRSEQFLHQRLETWQAILQSAPVGYLEVDSENYVYWYNTQASALLHIELRKYGSVVRRSLLQVVRSYELDQLVEVVRQQRRPQTQTWVFHALTASERSQDIPLRGSAFLLEGGHVGIFLEDCREAMQLAQERDRWTSDVAHELKTPLTSIRLIAETLQLRIEPSLQPWIERLIQETARLTALVQDILELSQLTVQEGHALKLTPVNVPKLIQNAWITLEPLAQHKNLVLYYEGPEDYTLQADSNRLLRVFLNLIDNSIKFSPQDAAIAIYVVPLMQNSSQSDTSSHATGIQIDIVDTGPGFPADSLSQVFKRFYKADPARGRTNDFSVPDLHSGSGSGLGLAIAHQIVSAHHGTIEARNHPDHGGAWMRITLPFDPALT